MAQLNYFVDDRGEKTPVVKKIQLSRETWYAEYSCLKKALSYMRNQMEYSIACQGAHC